MIRLPDDNPAAMNQALDIGTQTLLITMVESAEQAKRALRVPRYRPGPAVLSRQYTLPDVSIAQ